MQLPPRLKAQPAFCRRTMNLFMHFRRWSRRFAAKQRPQSDPTGYRHSSAPTGQQPAKDRPTSLPILAFQNSSSTEPSASPSFLLSIPLQTSAAPAANSSTSAPIASLLGPTLSMPSAEVYANCYHWQDGVPLNRGFPSSSFCPNQYHVSSEEH